jgi:predicted transposase/invertase (TIGR01784 family)
MNKERLNTLNDYLFMKYMGKKDDMEQLIAFLHKAHKDGIVSVSTLKNRQISAEIANDKANVLDIRAIIDNGTKANIKVQLRDAGNMCRRNLLYRSRKYVESIGAGQKYNNKSL